MTGVLPVDVSEAEALATCESEPIRTPERTQSHGATLVVDVDLNAITHVSGNIGTYLIAPPEAVLGRSLSYV